ncbi:hypothetical protein HELRODRAFT_164196 [Helobdella robusta]|uniref:Uncharacterized protein n=1 Tax=Helobdella robusta TaxID=6412 RepID=T1EV30_HELRO|nr:hypothetical protein HELRODRAFT_164196 [Helobdella robusta]ESN94365.1 hypothetical protein HELRODRAFT_164196 [Helobdella robusta]
MAESTRKKQDIYLLGQPLKTAILGNKYKKNFYREFLLAQREPGRRGYMSGVDKNLALKEARSYERKRRQENYKLKSVQAQEEITAGACSAEIEHSSSDSSSECESEEDSITKRVQVKRSRKSFDVPSTLCNVPLAVHWDGKLLLDLTGNQKVDRLPIVVAGAGVEKLLSVPKLESGTGERQATEVHECLLEWNLEESVKALVFDTTASNSGKKNGACTLLQQKLGRNVLHIACRHHISEIILEHAFSACMSSNTSGPEIALFLRFRNEFNSINQADYHTIMDDESLNSKVEQHKEGIVSFCLTQLEQFQPRCDYRELLELSLILLGETPPRGVRVLQPGALHRARWMARLIYAFKLYMYRHQFLLTRVEEKGICRFIVFGICVYLRSWFTAPDLLSAARHDLQLVKRIQQFRDVDREVSVAAANALSRHLWYVSEELVGAAFFDDQISHEEKVLMVDALSAVSKTTNDFTKRVQMNVNDISDEMSVKDFVVSSNTMQFFAILGLPHSFLNKTPSEGREDEQYKKAFEVVSGIKPVNDFAEMQDFNRTIVSSEEQKQYVLQVVEYHRTQYPNPKKETLVGGNTSP